MWVIMLPPSIQRIYVRERNKRRTVLLYRSILNSVLLPSCPKTRTRMQIYILYNAYTTISGNYQ